MNGVAASGSGVAAACGEGMTTGLGVSGGAYGTGFGTATGLTMGYHPIFSSYC